MPQGHCTLPPDDVGPDLGSLGGTRTGYPARGRSPSPAGHRPDQSTTLHADPRGRLLGGPGHGDVDRVADPPGLQARPPAPLRREDPASLQPLRGPATAGHRPGPPAVRAGRPSPGPARDARGLLPRVPPGGPRWRRSTMSPTPRPTPRPSAAPRPGRAATGPSPRSASSAWSSWGPTSNSPSWCGPSPMANSRWSAACFAI